MASFEIEVSMSDTSEQYLIELSDILAEISLIKNDPNSTDTTLQQAFDKLERHITENLTFYC